nr:hypothetical protein [Candidatus Sigynarchaeota archaeon]
MTQKSRLTLKTRWKIYLGTTAYYCTFGDILRGSQSELITCDYDEKLKAYSVTGAELLKMDFSSSILCFFVEHIFSDTSRDVITVDVNGTITLFTIKSPGNSEIAWTLKLSSPVMAAATTSIKGSGNVVIVVGLEGRKVVIVNTEGVVVLEVDFPGGDIKGLITGDFYGTEQQDIMVIDEHNAVYRVTRDGNVSKLLVNIDAKIIQARKMHFQNMDFLLCSSQDNKLYITDAGGTILLETPKLDAEIATIGAGRFTSQGFDDIAVCFENGSMAVFEPVLATSDKKFIETIGKARNSELSIRDTELTSKIKQILAISKRVNIEMVRDMLGIGKETFNRKLIDWAKQFGFKIDGEYIVLDNADVNGFVAELADLDKDFEEWDSKARSKDGKQ